MPTLSLADIRFLLARSRGEWLPEELGGLAPLGPTGIRDVQGLGNNTLDPTQPGYWFGAADTPFLRMASNRLTEPSRKNDIISSPFANSKRGPTETVVIGDTVTVGTGVNAKTLDSLNPRNISNLVADSSDPAGFQSLDLTDPNYALKLELKLQDDPTGRVSPVSGAVNPLPYSNWTSQFGQFFDHGLDFVAKGVDGKVKVDLLPSDGLYKVGVPGARDVTSITGSRNNTANVTIGEGSTDALLTQLGIMAQEGKPSWLITSTLTAAGDGTPVDGATYAYVGTLVLNNTLIQIQAFDEADLVAQINAYTPTTGVVASATAFPAIPQMGIEAGTFNFTLTPARAESFNQVSPFIDLSQTYGSDASRTFFLREYLDLASYKLQPNNAAATLQDVITGRLVNAGATVNGETSAGLANWAQIKANALKVGITLHDADVMAIPMLAIDQNGRFILDEFGGPQLVALNRVTGETVYVKDTNVADDLVLMTTKHAFLNDMGVRLNPLNDAGFWNGRDIRDPLVQDQLEAHYIAGDGRLNENIGLTAVQEVFLTEHNRVLTLLKQQYGFFDPANPGAPPPVGGWTWTDPLTNVQTRVTGEELFQQAKLFNEMIYQHLVFDQFVRKLSPNIAGFAGVDPLIDARVSSEFANAVYRLGHSMLPETVGMRKNIDATAIATQAGNGVITVTMANHGLEAGASITLSSVDRDIGGIAASLLNGTFVVTSASQGSFTFEVTGATATGAFAGIATDKVQLDINKGLIEAFLNPSSYIAGSTGALLTDGSTAQVGNRIDEKVTDALRDNLLGQPLDLALLNILRGRDAGLPTLNEMRASIQAVAPLALQATLNPYTSWTGFRDNLKGNAADQAATVKNFMMAYASDDILTKFASTKTLAQWYALRESTVAAEQDQYMAGLKAATDLAYANATWMGTGATANKDFNRIDAWMGGLAEREVVGGMLGATFDAVFAMQMMNLQNGDRFYYLGRVPATEFFIENMEGVMLADLVMRSTGATNVYADIFSVADKYIQMGDTAGLVRVATFQQLQASTTVEQVFDASGEVVNAALGRAGYVGNVFYGNPGDYADARGVLNPNGSGNASERITGTTGNDTVFGLGGNDDIRGGGGNDSLNGGSGVDYLYGDAGNDTLDGGFDNDFMYGGEGNDSMLGGIGVDVMFGNAGNDTMLGGIEADIMIGGSGDDLMYGGDNVVVAGVLDPDDPILAALLDDNLDGGAGNDTLYGGGGWDALAGASGHDMLVPGAGGLVIGGREAMDGGEGDDIYLIEDGLAFAHHDIADGGLTQLQLINKGAGFRQGNGIGVDEVRFTQTVEGNIILGGTNDLGIASAFIGVERVVIGTGTATAANRNGTTAINIDASLANPGLNVGLEILGNAGVNTLIGTAFDDVIDGGIGADIMEGGNGNDTYWVNDALDTVIEGLTGAGNDTVIVTGAFDYTLAADLENLELRNLGNLQGTGNELANSILGNAGNNVLSGLGGNDSIDGGAGNDRIIGGGGADRLTGGTGNDTFVFASVADIGNNPLLRETITDFAAGDVLDFSAIDANTTLDGQQGFRFVTDGAQPIAAGQLRYVGNVLYGYVDGDQQADFSIEMANGAALSSGSFVQSLSVARTTPLAVAEGSGATSTHSFTVTLSDARPIATNVNWAVTGLGQNAANAADFQTANGQLPSGTLTIGANQTTGTITITVLGDALVEQNESFTLTLSNPTTGVVLGTATATATITNDDVAASVINGTNGNNTLNGTVGNDIINGNGGNDMLSGAAGNDSLSGGTGNDNLAGGDGNDTLAGGTGNDTLNGGAGNDVLIGDAGVDIMVGGVGADIFRFNAAVAEIGPATGARDQITDFNRAEGDIIDLSAIDANTGQGGNQAFTFIGTANFGALGQLRYNTATRTLEGNVTGTNAPDFGIQLGVNIASVLASDLIL